MYQRLEQFSQSGEILPNLVTAHRREFDWVEQQESYLINVERNQCDQKKSPNVHKSCPKMISLEKW